MMVLGWAQYESASTVNLLIKNCVLGDPGGGTFLKPTYGNCMFPIGFVENPGGEFLMQWFLLCELTVRSYPALSWCVCVVSLACDPIGSKVSLGWVRGGSRMSP